MMHNPSVLDHLVPALIPDTYGKSSPLDALPLNVWMQSRIIPMTFDGFFLPTVHPVTGKPKTFRYRVVLSGGERRVERADVSNFDFDSSKPEGQRVIERSEPVLMVGRAFLAKPGSEFLPKIQHAVFARTATVDPKQDWRLEEKNPPWQLFGAKEIAIIGAVGVGGIYAIYKIMQRTFSPARGK